MARVFVATQLKRNVSHFGNLVSDLLPSPPVRKTSFIPIPFLFVLPNLFLSFPMFCRMGPPVCSCICLCSLSFPLLYELSQAYFPWPNIKPKRLLGKNSFQSLKKDAASSMHQTGRWWTNLNTRGNNKQYKLWKWVSKSFLNIQSWAKGFILIISFNLYTVENWFSCFPDFTEETEA